MSEPELDQLIDRSPLHKCAIPPKRSLSSIIYDFVCGLNLLNISIIILGGIILSTQKTGLKTKQFQYIHDDGIFEEGKEKLMNTALSQLFSVPYDEQLRIKQNEVLDNSIMSGSKKYFAYRRFLEPQNPLYHSLEHYYLNKQYNLFQSQSLLPQQQLCLILTGNFHSIPYKNLKKLLVSIERQNYQNYALLLDYSPTNQRIVDVLFGELKYLKQRTQFLNNMNSDYLERKRMLVRACMSQLIVDVPLSGQLIGRDVLFLLNKVITTNENFMLGFSESIFRANGTKFVQQAPSYVLQHEQQTKSIQLQSLKFFRKNLISQQEQTTKFPKSSPYLTEYHMNLLFSASLLQKTPNESVINLDEFVYFETHFSKIEFQGQFISYLAQAFHNQNEHDFLTFQASLKNQLASITHTYSSERTQKYKNKDWGLYMDRLLTRFLMEKHPTVNNLQFLHKFVDEKTAAQKANFAYNLWKYPENEDYMEAERFYYEHNYGKLTVNPQMPFCIVADGQIPELAARVNFSHYPNNDHTTFLASVARLEYQNFRLVLGLTEPEEEFRKNQVKRFLSLNYPYLLEKTTIVYSNVSLPNGRVKYNLIKNHCLHNQFVIPIQIDCQFIGRQPLKILNLLLSKFSNEEVPKLFYTDHLSLKQDLPDIETHDIELGTTVKQTKFSIQNHARTINRKVLFNSYYLFTFQRQLLDEISVNYLCPEENNCIKQLTDGFLFKALLKLSEGYNDFRHEILMFVSESNQVVREKGEATTLEILDEVQYLNIRNR